METQNTNSQTLENLITLARAETQNNNSQTLSDIIRSPSKPSCPYCSISFEDRIIFGLHLNSVHGLELSSEWHRANARSKTQTKNPSPGAEPRNTQALSTNEITPTATKLNCWFCSEPFQDNDILRMHLTNDHGIELN